MSAASDLMLESDQSPIILRMCLCITGGACGTMETSATGIFKHLHTCRTERRVCALQEVRAAGVTT